MWNLYSRICILRSTFLVYSWRCIIFLWTLDFFALGCLGNAPAKPITNHVTFMKKYIILSNSAECSSLCVTYPGETTEYLHISVCADDSNWYILSIDGTQSLSTCTSRTRQALHECLIVFYLFTPFYSHHERYSLKISVSTFKLDIWSFAKLCNYLKPVAMEGTIFTNYHSSGEEYTFSSFFSLLQLACSVGRAAGWRIAIAITQRLKSGVFLEGHLYTGINISLPVAVDDLLTITKPQVMSEVPLLDTVKLRYFHCFVCWKRIPDARSNPGTCR